MSGSLSQAGATWRGEHPDTARLVIGDVVAAVQALKDEPGDELQIWGSGNLLQTLLQHELVDRFRLMMASGSICACAVRGAPTMPSAAIRPTATRSIVRRAAPTRGREEVCCMMTPKRTAARVCRPLSFPTG